MNKAEEGRKYDGGKPMMSLVPPHALEEMAKVLTMGAKKYAVDNWKYVEDGKQRYMDAMLRHINAYIKGERDDPEFGTHHLAHAACCLYFILDADMSGVPLEPKAQKPQNHTPEAVPLSASMQWTGVEYDFPIGFSVAAQAPDYTQIMSYNIDFPPKSV